MASPDFAELAAVGREFKQEAFTDEFVAGLGPHVCDIPDAVVGQYAQDTKYYYVASPIERPLMLTDGLHAGLPLVAPEDEQFFSDQFAEQQFRRMDPNDQLVAESFVLGRKPDGTPKDFVLTAEAKPSYTTLGYGGVPERVKYFMRNMRALQILPEADPAARVHAKELVEKYSGSLVTDGQVEFTTYSVSPKSPPLARVFLHPMLTEVETADGVEAVSLAQHGVSRLETPGLIVPEHLAERSSTKVASAMVLNHILNNDSMVVFKTVANRA